MNTPAYNEGLVAALGGFDWCVGRAPGRCAGPVPLLAGPTMIPHIFDYKCDIAKETLFL